MMSGDRAIGCAIVRATEEVGQCCRRQAATSCSIEVEWLDAGVAVGRWVQLALLSVFRSHQ